VFYGSLLIVWLLHGTPAVSSALSDREVAEHAEAEFAEGVRLRHAADKARPHFREAAEYFEELCQRGAHNAELYRNLGNAHLLAGDLPRAILSYRRGLRLAPYDFALRENLNEAREQVIYPASGNLGRPRNESRPLWLPHVLAEWLVIAAAVCYAIAWGCLTRWLMVRRGRVLVIGLVALLLAGTATAWLIVRTREEQDQALHPLVVIARDCVLLRRGDGLTFPPRYDTPINRGVEGRRMFERGDWVQIELSGGEIGWVPREAVLVDETNRGLVDPPR
jgi:hypothetical protein